MLDSLIIYIYIYTVEQGNLFISVHDRLPRELDFDYHIDYGAVVSFPHRQMTNYWKIVFPFLFLKSKHEKRSASEYRAASGGVHATTDGQLI